MMPKPLTYQEEVNQLLVQQVSGWSMLRENLEGLKAVKIKEFDYNGCLLKVQFNPRRIKSSGAKVDKKTIAERPCFLCEANRPSEQRSVDFEGRYQILCNPYPIFSQHYTIVKNEHVPQLIFNEFGEMLSLSKALPDLAVFYNGPKCGASAPDHMHFQAGNRGLMSIEDNIDVLKRSFSEFIQDDDEAQVSAIDDGMRRFICIESEDRYFIQELFKKIYAFGERHSEEEELRSRGAEEQRSRGAEEPRSRGVEEQRSRGAEEPMMNIIAYYEKGWKIYVFLRGKHRPAQYTMEGEGNILFSPASVDMGGTLILPLEKDFDKICMDDIWDMMSQVAMKKSLFSALVEDLKNNI